MADVKGKHPSWFKMKLERRELVRQLSPETAVNVLLACWDYLETGEKPLGLSPIENVAFSSFMPDMDDAWSRYIQRITAKSNRTTSTETEVETDSISPKGDMRECGADKPPAPTRKKYDQYGWVKLTDSDYSRLLNDIGLAEVERCIAYIDESAQATGNKNRWRDWNLVIRRCHRDGWGLSQQPKGGGDKFDGYF